MSFNRLSDAEISLEQILHQIRKLTVQINQPFELIEILHIIVTEVRKTLESDRTIIYRFLPDGNGVVAEESVSPEWMPIQGQLIYDPCFNAQWVEQYQQGRIGVIEDIDTKLLVPCYKELLTKLQIRANLVVPILVNNQEMYGISSSSPQLWGLLITHQCGSPRQWSCLEIEFVQLVATQLGIVLQQSALKERQRAEDELRWQQALLRSMTYTSLLGFYVVDNRTDKILYFNDRFCEIWGIEHLKTQMRICELKNNDIIPDCLPLIADLTAFAESCKPLQSEQNRSTVENEILFVDGRTIRRFSSQLRDSRDQYFGRLYIFEDISNRLRTEIALRESEERYRSVITAMAEGIVLQQTDGRITACNESAEKILGLTTEQMMGRTSIDPLWKAIHEDGTPFPGETHPAIVTLHTGQPQFNVVMGVYKPDGSLTWISINSQPLFRLNELKPYAVVASFTDITARKQIELALQNQTQRERMVFAITQHIRQSLDLDEILNTTVAEVRHFLQTDRVIIYRMNADWSGIVVTESVAEGWKTILNMEITDTYFVETQGRQSYQQGMIKVTPDIYTAGLTACHLELLKQLQVRAKLVVPILQGDSLWGLLIVHHCRAPREWQLWESELLKQLATQVAITIQQSQLCEQLQLANQQLENLAMVDQLTQVGNRRVFDIYLNHIWHDLLRKKDFISLLLCDIDYFKQYNDTYGHAAGDTCLTLVAQAIKRTVKRSTDLVARYGGEEFAVILPDTDRDGAIHIAQQIHEAIQQMNISHTASTVKQCITLSIGIVTVIPVTDLVTLDLIKAADQALYQAKAQGRNRSFVNRLSF
ncbi:MAG: diguanylate cyclase [Nostoc sp. NOS(2021)]|uniref:diguanylate cyclase n=1 Tax=Nostoc sp. NOS(2021) TaxID=2815407 RepID=UPI0025FBB1EA|nr:diguanylate cyclase [Nostoc sp. NOS(2021)]MBN3894795.1 diguanylate cyclase [Nostoc sp. NOS(2021)]